MQLTKVVARRIRMKLKHPFQTSFSTQTEREVLVLEAHDVDGTIGYAESVAGRDPFYSEETVATTAVMLEEFLVPMLFNATLDHPDEVSQLFKPVRRNNMAISAIEGAMWDIYAKQRGESLSTAFGGTKKQVEVGVSIGLQPTDAALVEKVAAAVDAGFKRIKMKVKPGRDVEMIRAVRREFAEVPLMVDANSAYTLDDIPLLRQFDDFNLMMIEQPLAHDDIVDHAVLQKAIATPICLDESIHSTEDARKAIALGACQIINIKTGRVGGLTAAKALHELCADSGIPVWCGGMLETGIGRAHNIAMSTLPNFALPGDTAPSANYWREDIIVPAVTMDRGVIDVPNGHGIGFEINQDALGRFTLSTETWTPTRLPAHQEKESSHVS